MSMRQGRRGGRREAQTAPNRSRCVLKEDALDDLLREAEEALRECELPSGDWKAGGRAPRPRPAAPVERPSSSTLTLAARGPGAGLADLEDLDSEVAFWLLFPPRGNA